LRQRQPERRQRTDPQEVATRHAGAEPMTSG
jgi:hypothetical protein